MSAYRQAPKLLTRAFAAIALAAMVPAGALAATTYHVRVDGNDSACSGKVNAANPGSGTVPRPCAFRTPQKGVDSAVGGDTVLIHAGTYATAGTTVQSNTDIVGIDLRSEFQSEATRLTIDAAGDGTVMFDGDGTVSSGITIWGTSFVTVEGIAFQNFKGDVSPSMHYGAAAVNVGSPDLDHPSSRIILSDLTVSNSTLDHANGTVAEIAIWCEACTNNFIENCQIRSVEPSAIAVGSPTTRAVDQRGVISHSTITHARDQQIWNGIFGDHTSIWRIEGNYIEEAPNANTTDDLIRVEDSAEWQILDNVLFATTRNGVDLIDNTLDGSDIEGHVVLNNTIDCNTTLGRGARLYICDACEVRNNIIAGCASGVVLGLNNNLTELGFNGFFDLQEQNPYNASSEFGFGYTLVQHDVISDPLFQATLPRPDPYYRLSQGSPMLDVGDNDFCAVVPADGTCDMGAFQTLSANDQQPPERPSIVLVDKITGRAARLTGSAFSDPNPGDTHTASQWQIDVAGGDFSHPVADSGIVSDTAVSTPRFTLGGLQAETEYIARVRYRDDRGAWSEWSDPDINPEAAFTTFVATAIPPRIVSSVPQAGAINVTIPTTVALTFNVPVDPSTVTSSTVRLLLAGVIVPQAGGSPSVDGTGLVVTITPASLLSPGFKYRASVLGGVNGVHSRDESIPGVNSAIGFTTELGLVSSNPANGGTGVSLGVAPQLDFKWNVDPSTATTTTVVLRDVTSGKKITLSSVTASGTTVTLTPASPLKANHKHSVTVLSGVSGLKFSDGRLLGKKIKVSFKTGTS